MRSTRLISANILFLFLSIFTATTIVRAADDEADDYDVKARVARISLIAGDVNLKRNGNTDWERARLNFPLVEGDTVSTDRESRLEIQIDGRNFVRLGAETVLRIVTLRDEGVALSVVEGSVVVRLAKFDHDHEYFEIDAPKTTLAAEKQGLYRIDVAREGRVHLTARDGGRARIYSDTSGFALRDGRAAELIYEGADAGDRELLVATAADSLDSWVSDRERYLAQRMHYDVQYYDQYVWGAEDLDSYGDWMYASDYGWVWRPHSTVINIYNDWAPYRYGNWTWCPPYGWTWVGYEPWGWAPYHYGRWVYFNNYWAWCPRSHYYRHRSWWRPALVAFVSIHFSFGDNFCWYPLSYHQRDPHSRYYQNVDRLTALRPDELRNLRRTNPAYLRAVTTLPAKELGGDNVRLRPANEELARRVIGSEPLRGDLPLRPAFGSSNAAVGGTGGDRADRSQVARPARVTLGVQIPDRPTGAAARTLGVPLDNELRRTRVLNGRDPTPSMPAESTTTGASESRPTGAVARPARPIREPADGSNKDDSNRNVDRNVSPDEPSSRPSRTLPRQELPVNPANNEGDEQPRERRPAGVPARPSAGEDGLPAVRPTRPSQDQPPERIVRPTAPPSQS